MNHVASPRGKPRARAREQPAPRQPARTLTELANELEQLTLRFERARDSRCVFARAYATLTRVLASAVPTAGFSDPDWVEATAFTFSGYYLRAIDAYDAGTLPKGAWATVFDAGARGQTSVLEDLVLGMTAHIVNDLPHALGDVGLTTQSGQTRIADYHLLNHVLASAINRIQNDISKHYDPFLGALDHLFENYDEILTSYGLRISRATAWYNALRLLDPASREAASSAIAQCPTIVRRELLDPPAYSLRLLFRGARVLSREFRRWPAATATHHASAPKTSDRRDVSCPPTSI